MSKFISLLLLNLLSATSLFAAESLIASGAKIEKVAEGFGFTEGPAVDSNGDIYFVDDPNSKIYFWSVAEKKLSVFVEKSEHANGMFVDKADNLVVCEGGTGSVVSYNKSGKRTVIASTFEGKRFNKPNDLWIDPKGGIYFTDPIYGAGFKLIQDGEHVYYILPDRSNVLKVVTDMQKPNGIVGTKDGKILYITDQQAGKVWRYMILPDGTLADKTLFSNVGIDGMTLDEWGNLYITAKDVIVFNPDGKEIERIKFPEEPANVCFGGKERKTLFVTARKGLYSIEMNVHENH